MAQNYVLLERIELNASAASVTFSNIPQSGYTDLKVVYSSRITTTDNIVNISFNGSTTTFTNKLLYGTGATAASDSSYLRMIGESTISTDTASTFSNSEVYIPNYTSSNYKSWSSDSVIENNATAGYQLLNAGLWSNTAAITSIAITSNTGNFVQYSTFSLYALAAVGTTPTIAPKASGGNITTDGTYWIHTFLTTQTFTPFTNLTCDYLVIAGGGGGGSGSGGGGGAGGYRTSIGGSPLSTTSGTSYSITVGAGGAGAGNTVYLGSNGTTSTFSTINTTGGGGGGRNVNSAAGNSGGSGGGGGFATGAGGAGNAGSYSPVEGYAGGASGGAIGSGGGGGASAVGTTSTLQGGAAGGAGKSNSISGTSTDYAGGGGGGGFNNFGVVSGSGGSATFGGGSGGSAPTSGNGTAGSNGTINTGAGGGGGGAAGSGGSDGAGGTGGAGIVIIRYAMA
jgi:hypothetical protein